MFELIYLLKKITMMIILFIVLEVELLLLNTVNIRRQDLSILFYRIAIDALFFSTLRYKNFLRITLWKSGMEYFKRRTTNFSIFFDKIVLVLVFLCLVYIIYQVVPPVINPILAVIKNLPQNQWTWVCGINFYRIVIIMLGILITFIYNIKFFILNVLGFIFVKVLILDFKKKTSINGQATKKKHLLSFNSVRKLIKNWLKYIYFNPIKTIMFILTNIAIIIIVKLFTRGSILLLLNNDDSIISDVLGTVLVMPVFFYFLNLFYKERENKFIRLLFI